MRENLAPGLLDGEQRRHCETHTRAVISVVVPLHNEERSIALLHEELQAALDPLDQEWEAVYVDDGSTDESFSALTRLHARENNVRVVRLRRNFGKAAALAAGFAQASGELVVTIDGDLQDDPSEIPRLLAKLEEGFDLVSGWKTRRRDPLSRRVPSKVFNWVAGWMSGLRLHDMNCGLKAYRGEVVRSLVLYGELHRFIPVLAHEQGYRVAELPVNHRPREHGRSRYGLERYLRGFLDLLTVSFMGRYRHRPLHLFGGLGLLLGGLGVAILVYLTVVKLAGPRDRAASAAHARRAARRRRDAVLHARADQRDDHEPPRGARGRARAARRARRGSPVAELARSLLRHLRTRLSAQRTGDRVPAQGRRRGERAARAGLGGKRAQVCGRRRDGTSARARRVVALPACAVRLRCARRRVSRTPRPARGEASRARAAGRLQPTRLARRHPRRGPRRGSLPARSRHARCAPSIARRSRLADLVVADTEAHAALFREIGARRVEVCLVGAEERVFEPGWRQPAEFSALFVGKLIPLHGLETILEAARRAPDLRFRVVGSGQREELLRERPANVEWQAWVEYERLPGELNRAGCALGIFGTTPKARRVIPNKVFQALACGTPVITADTPAARELLRDGESALLVPPGDPDALAGAAPKACRGARAGADDCGRRTGRVSGTRERGHTRRAMARADREARLALRAAIAAFAAGFGALSMLRHRSFETGRFDLGNMVQAVWSTAHGHPLRVTTLTGEQAFRLGAHVDPVLMLFAPLWWLWPSPDLLLVTQAVAIALGALPVYWLARKHLASERAGVGFALTYLVYPPTTWLALNEFHPGGLAMPALLYAFWYLDEDRLAPFAVFAVLAPRCVAKTFRSCSPGSESGTRSRTVVARPVVRSPPRASRGRRSRPAS